MTYQFSTRASSLIVQFLYSLGPDACAWVKLLQFSITIVSFSLSEGAAVHYEPDEAVKEKRHEEYTKNVYPVLLAKLNALIEENNGYLATGKVRKWRLKIRLGISFIYITSCTHILRHCGILWLQEIDKNNKRCKAF